ncbi:N-acetyltransferase [Streptacidiphilus pinicola]|uniref:N-acetyltransferase n=1 Tax=Streptacidiphilus pinicola TaxID=2219663 RepID=A0A2X0IB62_9ACTN|nr:GNAT family N-acetyltransferase [Streptacidiphilus pinicola]RAG81757.1 N-acetyltransferase [Streptacidiphilus pinicola]
MAAHFRIACTGDIDELLTLYRAVYGSTYTLPLGTDREVMAREINSATTTWLVARDISSGRLVASILGTVAPQERLGKLQGLAVHPDARGGGIARQAVRELSDRLLAEQPVDSVYATARTNSTAPQRICLQSDFRALGVFPNLRKSERHETMVLLARHRPGVLEQRLTVPRVPAGLGGLVDALHQTVGLAEAPRPHVEQRTPETSTGPVPPTAATSFELVDAPAFVRRRFAEALPDPGARFYPFHAPNVLLTAEDGGFEVYAQLNRGDGYCALVATAPALAERGGDLDAVICTLSDHGALHIETLLPLDHYADLNLLLGHGFLPAAAYPAMRREGDGYRDYVVMARTMKPLDFRGLAIDAAFRPFTEQYIELWKQQYLNTHGIFQ